MDQSPIRNTLYLIIIRLNQYKRSTEDREINNKMDKLFQTN